MAHPLYTTERQKIKFLTPDRFRARNIKMADLPSPSSISMSSEEVDACIEQCFNFIRKSKKFSVGETSGEETVVESFVDSLTDEEIKRLRKKMLNFWETTKTKHRHAEVNQATLRHHESEPPTQSEEAVISFEDAKLDAGQQTVKCYNLEQLIEVELKEIRNSKLSQDNLLPASDTTTKTSSIESMDFTELEKKAADLPGRAVLEITQRQESVPVLKSTDSLEVLLHVYEYSSVDSTEKSDVSMSIDETESRPLKPVKEINDFQLFLVNEMKIIYDRLATICPLVKHRSPVTADTSNSSDNSNTKNSSSPKITPGAVTSPGAEGYPEFDSSSASGLINEPVLDMAAAVPASKSSAAEESGNTTSSTVSEDNTLSGVSSIPTDPRASVSSLRDLDPRASPISLDAYPRTSVDVYPRTSASSMRDPNSRTSLDVESLGPSSPLLQQAMLEDDSDDAFLTASMDTHALNGAQNLRRRGLSSQEDEDDKSDEAKRLAL